MLNIQEWNSNIATAITRGTSQLTIYRDIREFFPVVQQRDGRLRRPDTDGNVNYVRRTDMKIQQTVFSFFLVLEIRHV